MCPSYYCIENANQKCDWFGSPVILLSGISNWLSVHLNKNVTINTFNQLWSKLHQFILALQLLYLKFIIVFLFLFSDLWQEFIISLIVNVWLFIHLSELWKLSIKDVYYYIFHKYIPSVYNYIRSPDLYHAFSITLKISIITFPFHATQS